MDHPSTFLSTDISGLLREEAAQAELQRDLTARQLATIYEQQWFKALAPAGFGGGSLSLPEIVRLEEGVAWADGSVGWVVTLCSGAGWFSGFFSSSTSLSGLFSDPRLCLAGSGAATGQAHQVPGGYRISGRWAYASGALHASAFTANCVIMKEGQALRDEQGQLLVRAFILLPSEVEVIRDWDTIGLVASGSHGFAVNECMVTEDRVFDIHPEKAKDDHLLYRYPFLPLAEATLAANISGMAVHFLDECKLLFESRRLSESARAQMDAGWQQAWEQLQQHRDAFYSAVDGSWNNRDIGSVSKASRALSDCARRCVDQLYPMGGLGAAKPGSSINRVWRDFHTATQHNLLAFAL